MLFLDPDLVRFAFERKRKAERESEQVRKEGQGDRGVEKLAFDVISYNPSPPSSLDLGRSSRCPLRKRTRRKEEEGRVGKRDFLTSALVSKPFPVGLEHFGKTWLPPSELYRSAYKVVQKGN